MPDTTQTTHKSVQEALERELVQIAMAGLSAGRLAKRHREFPTAFGLSRVAAAGDDPEAQAGELIQLVIEGAKLIEGAQLSSMTAALFGIELRYRDQPYDFRRGMAKEIWDPEEVRRDESWTRRVLMKIKEELAASMLRINSSWEQASDPQPATISLGTGSLRDQKHSAGLDRISVRVETWLTGRGQRPYQTDWTYRDRATRAGIDSYRLFRRATITLRVEPVSDNVKSVVNRGTDANGFTIWRANFERPLALDEEIEWTTRTVFDGSQLNQVEEAEWLAVSVSHSGSVGPIRRGEFIAHFDKRFPVQRAVKFITPKGSLPDLLGPIDELPIAKDGSARALFTDLQPWFTHGIYWWPDRSSI
jgi:hypothetical protein